MKGLLTKDFLSLKSVLKSYIFSIFIFIVIGVFTKNIMYITMLMSISSINQTFTNLSYDSMNNWDKFALSLPITRKDIVVSKYLYSSILLISTFLVSTLISYFGIYLRSNITLKDLILTHYSVFFIMLLLNNIILPTYFKYGVEKARNTLLSIFIIIFTIIGVLFYYLNKKPSLNYIYNNEILILISSILFLLFITLISYFLSIKTYENKDI